MAKRQRSWMPNLLGGYDNNESSRKASWMRIARHAEDIRSDFDRTRQNRIR